MMLDRFKAERTATVSKDGGTIAIGLAVNEIDHDNYIDSILLQLLGDMEECDQAGGIPGNGDRDQQPQHHNLTKGTNRNGTSSSGGSYTSRFQGQDQTDMKGVVIDHSMDHRTSVSQPFDTFYKAVKVAAGKLNSNLAKLVQTLTGLADTDYSDIHKKEIYSQLWLEEKKEQSKDRKKYKSDIKKLFAIIYGQLSIGTTKRLKDWKTIIDDADALKLI
eukprot:jgi/Psemu1/18566/gm1.18566_g